MEKNNENNNCYIQMLNTYRICTGYNIIQCNIFQFSDVDYIININLFYSDIFSIINYFFPTIPISNNSNFPTWFSHELKCIIKEKNYTT